MYFVILSFIAFHCTRTYLRVSFVFLENVLATTFQINKRATIDEKKKEMKIKIKNRNDKKIRIKMIIISMVGTQNY